MKKLLEMKKITKRFPGVTANDQIDFTVNSGEIHALLGENGSGKTTLMNILYGLYQADEGEIYFRGEKINIKSPLDAINFGIGMVHQHLMLINRLTVTENIALAIPSSKRNKINIKSALDIFKALFKSSIEAIKGFYKSPLYTIKEFFNKNMAKEKEILLLSKKYGFQVNPRDKIWQLSLGERQVVEIIKALCRGVDLLILDEPTSVLTPIETKEFFKTLKLMKKEGRTIIFISHKLNEVMEISDRITVLRNGKVVSTVEKRKTDKRTLAKLMVGREVVFRLKKRSSKKGKIILEVKNLSVLNDKKMLAVKNISFNLRGGEILGIGGVSGNGQRELAEAITGLRRVNSGKVFLRGKDVTNLSRNCILNEGVGFVPEEMIDGLVKDFSIAENLILEDHYRRPFANNYILNEKEINSFAEKLIQEYSIKTSGLDVPVKLLSGGNLQRALLARELSREPKFLVAAQPTRGLDIGATEYIRKKLLEQRDQGIPILLISEDLDEILMLSDRILIMFEGESVGIIKNEEVDLEKIGMMMCGSLRLK